MPVLSDHCRAGDARHLLVVPRSHAASATEDPAVARAAELAAWLGIASYNLITSVGAAATQTVLHTHVHLVERRFGDRLRLPWSPSNPCNCAQ